MKLVRENIEFQRGNDPKQSLDVGRYENKYDPDNSEIDDKIELQTDLYEVNEYSNIVAGRLVTKESIDEEIKLKYKKGSIFTLIEGEGWVDENGKEHSESIWIILDTDSEAFKKIRN